VRFDAWVVDVGHCGQEGLFVPLVLVRDRSLLVCIQ